MFTKAKIKLTAVYSILVLGVFWLLSGAVYIWMSRSLKEGYISQVREISGIIQPDYPNNPNNPNHVQIVTIAGSVALNRLFDILISLNLILPLIVPQVSWILVKRSFAPVEEAHRRQKRFVTDASHELRTPLSVMSGEIEVSLTKNRTPAQYKQVLNETLSEIKRLTRLVENLLFFARENRHQESIKDDVDITDATSSVLLKLTQIAKQKQVHLIFIPDKNSSLIRGNYDLIGQLIYNLVQNAITYTPSGGKITVKIKNTKKTVNLTIIDTGVGIPTKDQPHIFERFYRVDESRKAGDGYGLGLAICRAITTWHNGTIQVKSKLGKGTHFNLTFPLSSHQ